MQAARSVIGLAGEFAPGMQRGQDHLKRTQFREFRVRVHRNAAAIIAHHQPIIGFQRYLNPVGMAGHGLIHRVVDDLRRQMMQRVFIRATNIHARATADGLQPLQNLDILGGIAFLLPRPPLSGAAATEKIVHVLFPDSRRTYRGA